jgi:hypothetical protein
VDPSLLHLLLGSAGAIGAALSVGTLAALVRYRRTGEMPGADGPVSLSNGHLAGLWARVVVGAGLAVWAAVTLVRAGLL